MKSVLMVFFFVVILHATYAKEVAGKTALVQTETEDAIDGNDDKSACVYKGLCYSVNLQRLGRRVR